MDFFFNFNTFGHLKQMFYNGFFSVICNFLIVQNIVYNLILMFSIGHNLFNFDNVQNYIGSTIGLYAVHDCQ